MWHLDSIDADYLERGTLYGGNVSRHTNLTAMFLNQTLELAEMMRHYYAYINVC